MLEERYVVPGYVECGCGCGSGWYALGTAVYLPKTRQDGPILIKSFASQYFQKRTDKGKETTLE